MTTMTTTRQHIDGRIGVRMLVLMIATLLLSLFPAAARAAETTLTDCTAQALVDAVSAANSNPGADTITLKAGCTYTLNAVDNYWYGPNGLPPIASEIAIEGNGAVIERGSDPAVATRLRFFYVGADPASAVTKDYNSPGAGKLALRHLTLRNGRQQGGDAGQGGGGAGMGGAIFNQGTLILEGVTLTGNTAQGGSTDPYASQSGGGMGGAGFGGSVAPSGSSGGSSGSARGGGGGGGFEVSANGLSADGRSGAAGGGTADGLGGTGGGIRGAGGASGSGSGGGGVNPFGPYGGSGGGFGHTSATRYADAGGGGGVGAGGGAANGFKPDVSTGGGGGFGGGGGYGGGDGGSGGFGGGGAETFGAGGFGGGSGEMSTGGGGAGMGGAIFNHNGTLRLINSTLAGNAALGGSSVRRITGNSGSGFGGAVFNLNGTLNIVHSTLADNRVAAGLAGSTPGDADGASVYNLAYDSAREREAKLTLRNSILAGGNDDHNLVSKQPGFTRAGANLATATVIFEGANIVEGSVVDSSSGPSPLSADSRLGTLADNTGLPATMALAPDSPALDAAPSGSCTDLDGNPLAVDQRGVARPNGAACDLGAFENTERTPPDITAEVVGTLGHNGWYVGDVSVTWLVADEESAVTDQSNCDPVIIQSDTDAAGTTLTCTATSAGGIGSESVTIQRDTTAPTITCDTADGLWHNDDVSIPCTATDSGAGPATQSVSVSTSVAANTETANAATNSQSICDAAGNCATTAPISGNQVDKKAPALQSCDAPDGQWHANNVTLGCTYSDGGSGLASPTVGLSTNVAAGSEDANATASTRSQVCDVVGNCAAPPAAISGNKIDRQAPSITITSPTNATYVLNQAVAAGYSCADGGAGVATCAGPITSGSTIDTASIGARTFAVQAGDNVGNTASQSVSYSVGYAFSGFLAPVKAAPTVNTGKAGKTYPVKWQLTDANGAPISRLDAVQAITYQRTSCAAFSSEPTAALETSTTGGTSLRYDSTTNQYVYHWATPATMGCYTLFLTLDSGQVFSAYFSLD